MGVAVMRRGYQTGRRPISAWKRARYATGSARSAAPVLPPWKENSSRRRRASDGPFPAISMNFAGRIDPRSVNKALIENTRARAGAFDRCVEPDRARV